MSDLTAIDILINPDDAMIKRATSVNERMLQSVPAPTGFALDEHHRPHITTLQRYVRTDTLPQVLNAVQGVLESLDLSTLTFTTITIKHLVLSAENAIAEGAIVVRPGPEVLDFQAKLIEALRPFTGTGGTADAYVRTDTEPDINSTTLEYIEHYVPEHSGDNYLAHVTASLASLADLATIEAEPLAPLTFSAGSLSVYQLGDNGTAAKHLKSWSV